MPRNLLFSKEEIVEAALNLTRERGFSALSARSLGEELGTSSRPIFSHFEGMAQVQESVIAAARERYQAYLKEEMESGKYPPYKGSGMAYIRFAREERELFRLLFMRERTPEENGVQEVETEGLIRLIRRQVTGITEEQAQLFFLEMWAYVHGIATMIATGYYDWSEELAGQMLTDMYSGLKAKYEQ